MASSPNRSADDIVDPTPLLSNNSGGSSDESNSDRHCFAHQQSLRNAAWFLRPASSRRLMRESSMLVRETTAEQLEEQQSDWAYSKPVVVLDVVWNFAFVVVAATVLVLSRRESPSMPIWIVGYALQCMIHVVCVFRQRTFGRFDKTTRRRGRYLFVLFVGIASTILLLVVSLNGVHRLHV